MTGPRSVVRFRVRYGETDQMGGYYYAHALAWFECARTDLLRDMGTPYTEMEARGVFLPVVEAHVEYLGRARYDDHLEMTVAAVMSGRARIRCDVHIKHVEGGADVAKGYTVHAFVNRGGKPVRPPAWFLEALEKARPAE